VNGPSIVIRAPFTVDADSSFQFEIAPQSQGVPLVLGTAPLRGRGVAAGSFLANSTLPSGSSTGFRYDFPPTPEPATLLLVAETLLVFRVAAAPG
jgi:hypothetical protein